MSNRARLIRRLRASVVIPPPPPIVLGITYDNSIGNGVGADGLTDLPLRPAMAAGPNTISGVSPTTAGGWSYSSGTITGSGASSSVTWSSIVSGRRLYRFQASYTMTSGSKLRLVTTTGTTVWTSATLAASGAIDATINIDANNGGNLLLQADSATFTGTLTSLSLTDVTYAAEAPVIYWRPDGSDANNGTTHTLAVQSWSRVLELLRELEGTHILIPQGASFATVPPTFNGRLLGYSLQYPMMLRSYDPVDSTNRAKWGRSTYANRPVFTGDTSAYVMAISPVPGHKFDFFGVQGVALNAGNISGQGFGTGPDMGDGFLFENNTLHYAGLGVGNSALNSQHWVIRKNGIYGGWHNVQGSTSGSGIYLDGCKSTTIEDNVLFHNGWKVGGAGRSDPTEGATLFRHAMYLQLGADCVVRRNLIIEGSADGGKNSGNVLRLDNLVINCPIGVDLGGGSNYETLRPTGVDQECTDVILGTQSMPDSGARWGISTANCRPISRAHHFLVARASPHGSAYQIGTTATAGAAGQKSYMKFEKGVSYDRSDSGGSIELDDKGYPSALVPSFAYLYWDDSASGTNLNKSSLTTPNAYADVPALMTAGGYASLQAFIDYSLANVTLTPWRAVRDLARAGFAVPARTQETLAATCTLLKRGVIDHSFFINVNDGATLTAVGSLPAGLTLDSDTRSWRFDGTGSGAASGTFTVRETLNGVTNDSVINYAIAA